MEEDVLVPSLPEQLQRRVPRVRRVIDHPRVEGHINQVPCLLIREDPRPIEVSCRLAPPFLAAPVKVRRINGALDEFRPLPHALDRISCGARHAAHWNVSMGVEGGQVPERQRRARGDIKDALALLLQSALLSTGGEMKHGQSLRVWLVPASRPSDLSSTRVQASGCAMVA